MTEQEYYKKYWEFREIAIDKMQTLEKYKEYQKSHEGVKFDNIKKVRKRNIIIFKETK